uniref:Uncharacterized protein n=1 Tax=Oryza meridionalis TaxID=40149 RepID=A0A0E0CX26_9ORYZ
MTANTAADANGRAAPVGFVCACAAHDFPFFPSSSKERRVAEAGQTAYQPNQPVSCVVTISSSGSSAAAAAVGGGWGGRQAPIRCSESNSKGR